MAFTTATDKIRKRITKIRKNITMKVHKFFKIKFNENVFYFKIKDFLSLNYAFFDHRTF